MVESRACIEVIKPGILTTIQDLGRVGYQAYGMVVSGAMDTYALRVGNILVGNDESEAGIECTIIGPIVHFLEDAYVAITGGDLSPSLDGVPMRMWTSYFISKGSILEMGRSKEGARAYITVRGGIEVPLLMGSRSTYLRANIGGYMGRALQTGDRVNVFLPHDVHTSALQGKLRRRSLHPMLIPSYSSPIKVRVILGPQADAFHTESIQAFLNTSFQISPQSDRMGYRLHGIKIKHIDAADILTDAIVMGSIQVPASGDPIILMADRQTTGGYLKIATVISVDLPLLAQAKPGDKIRFTAVTIEEAHQLYIEQENKLRSIDY